MGPMWEGLLEGRMGADGAPRFQVRVRLNGGLGWVPVGCLHLLTGSIHSFTGSYHPASVPVG